MPLLITNQSDKAIILMLNPANTNVVWFEDATWTPLVDKYCLTCHQGEKQEPPPGTDPGDEHSGQNRQSEDEHHRAAHQPFAPFLDADIGNTNIACRCFHS